MYRHSLIHMYKIGEYMWRKKRNWRIIVYYIYILIRYTEKGKKRWFTVNFFLKQKYCLKAFSFLSFISLLSFVFWIQSISIKIFSDPYNKEDRAMTHIISTNTLDKKIYVNKIIESILHTNIIITQSSTYMKHTDEILLKKYC